MATPMTNAHDETTRREILDCLQTIVKTNFPGFREIILNGLDLQDKHTYKKLYVGKRENQRVWATFDPAMVRQGKLRSEQEQEGQPIPLEGAKYPSVQFAKPFRFLVDPDPAGPVDKNRKFHSFTKAVFILDGNPVPRSFENTKNFQDCFVRSLKTLADEYKDEINRANEEQEQDMRGQFYGHTDTAMHCEGSADHEKETNSDLYRDPSVDPPFVSHGTHGMEPMASSSRLNQTGYHNIFRQSDAEGGPQTPRQHTPAQGNRDEEEEPLAEDMSPTSAFRRFIALEKDQEATQGKMAELKTKIEQEENAALARKKEMKKLSEKLSENFVPYLQSQQ